VVTKLGEISCSEAGRDQEGELHAQSRDPENAMNPQTARARSDASASNGAQVVASKPNPRIVMKIKEPCTQMTCRLSGCRQSNSVFHFRTIG